MRKALSVLLVVGLAQAAYAESAADSAVELSPAYSITQGGKLYDKWFKVNGAAAPETAHPAYPAQGAYRGKKGDDWRCKECHGWDYRGAQGAYTEGNKHFTGIKGIDGAAGKPTAEIVALLRDATHGYTESQLSEQDAQNLAAFVSGGQIEMSRFVDAQSKAIGGDAQAGQGYYQTLCASCHALDGKGEEDALGELARKNPWETLHKIRFGQPGKKMPAFYALDMQVAVDILSYLQKTLP